MPSLPDELRHASYHIEQCVEFINTFLIQLQMKVRSYQPYMAFNPTPVLYSLPPI